MTKSVPFLSLLLTLSACSRGNSEVEKAEQVGQDQDQERAKMANYEEAVNSHYGSEDLQQQILDALQAAGKDPENLTREDIAGFSEFHIGGRAATQALAEFAAIEEGQSVLDIGSGLGGPARTLAADFGARVTALELVKAYHEAAQMLTEKVGVEGVTFVQGNALEIPAEDDSFDVVWMQHVQMNIEDKRALLEEIARVLKPGGLFATHTILRGQSSEAVVYPVPWADSRKLSFMATEQEFKRLLADAGFSEKKWKDSTADAVAFFEGLFEKLKSRPEDAPPPLGLNVLMGASTKEKASNVLKNAREDRISVIMTTQELEE